MYYVGVQLKDESNHDSILETVQELSPKCVPKSASSVCDEGDDRHCDGDLAVNSILLGGDQLSTSMARRVIMDRANSMDDIQCLKGSQPVVEDWHTKLCFLTVRFVLD